MPKVYKLNLVCPCRRRKPDSIPKLGGIGHFHRLVQNWTALRCHFHKFTINYRKIIRMRTIYSRFRIELKFPVKWLDSDFDKFKGVKTGREQTCILPRNLVLIVVKIIRGVFGFRVVYLCFIAFIQGRRRTWMELEDLVCSVDFR